MARKPNPVTKPEDAATEKVAAPKSNHEPKAGHVEDLGDGRVKVYHGDGIVSLDH